MNQDNFERHEKALQEELNRRLAVNCEKPALVELSSDLSTLQIFLREAVEKIELGGKSRPRSLAITKLQEASFWLNEEMRVS